MAINGVISMLMAASAKESLKANIWHLNGVIIVIWLAYAISAWRRIRIL
jgi:hypothetical protein